MPVPALLQGRLRLPVVGSPLFIVSNPDLVIAQCKAGIVGSFPALNARPKEQLQIWLRRISSGLAACDHAAPFAVNQIVHASNDRLGHDMEVCERFRVPIVITSLFYISPVFYPVEMIPVEAQPFYYLNPVVGLLRLFHVVLYEGGWPSATLLAGVSVTAIVTCAVGHGIFKRCKESCVEIA